jgi:CheY-like chemotaxis protein
MGLALQVPAQVSSLRLIDDDRSLASLIAEYCGVGGFSVTSALSGEEGIRLARQQRFLLIILDVMLPGMDGFEVLKRLRLALDTPILMLTTRGAALDRVHGLENGADDYLAKPFQPEELVARIKSILRRVHPKDGLAKFTMGDITVDESQRSIRLSYPLMRAVLRGEPGRVRYGIEGSSRQGRGSIALPCDVARRPDRSARTDIRDILFSCRRLFCATHHSTQRCGGELWRR